MRAVVMIMLCMCVCYLYRCQLVIMRYRICLANMTIVHDILRFYLLIITYMRISLTDYRVVLVKCVIHKHVHNPNK